MIGRPGSGPDVVATGDEAASSAAIEPPASSALLNETPGVRSGRRWSARRLLAREEWADALLPTITFRVVLMAFAALAVIVFRPDALGSDPALGIWNRWDAPRIFAVAAQGYGPSDPAGITVFPLFPLAVRIGSLVATPLGAGMAISLLATLAAAVGLYRLVRLDDARPAGRAAVVAMLAFPTAFALVAPYSEALFLALTLWCYVEARRGDWRGAGLLGALAAFTRLPGAFLLPALAVEYWVQRRRVGRDFAWVLAIASGPIGYLALNAAAFGSPLYFVAVQRDKFLTVNEMPWQVLGGLWAGLTTHPLGEFWATVYLAPALAFLALAGGTAWSLTSRRSRPSYAVYAVLSLVSLASLSWPISVPRYVLGVFPVFLALGAVSRRPGGIAVIAGSLLLLGVCTTLFVIGHWAF